MKPGFPFKKVVNALIPNATPTLFVKGVTLGVIDQFSALWGGLWVGGSIEFSNDQFRFKANSLNEGFHVGLEPVEIPTNQIRSIVREFGWFTGIVVINHDNGIFKFRCYNATNVAKHLSSLLGLA